MDIHKNAHLTPHGRAWMVRQVESGQPPKAVAEAGHAAGQARGLEQRPYGCPVGAGDALAQVVASASII
ncbi:MAG TPA: hypothetical protein VMU85_00795 [Stellaceae bacterium]|nr:hypothetical protein [Stellaceae bacterium]